MPKDKTIKFKLWLLWLNLWDRLGATGNPRRWFYDMLAYYSSPSRFYHNFNHIFHCLKEFEQVRTLVNNPEAVELAIWYHDVVYNTQRKDNEEVSAMIAAEMIRNSGLSQDLESSVVQLVLATKHTELPTDLDAQLIMDIDLAILGQPEEIFDAYEADIRQEYAWVPDEVFADGRSKILKLFLDRPTIYSTKFFQDKYEVLARQNLARSLKKLANRS